MFNLATGYKIGEQEDAPSANASVSAANWLADRGFGKPKPIEPDQPFEASITIINQMPTEAKKPNAD